MASPRRGPGRPPRGRAALSRDVVLRAALAVVDRDGLEALSMRAVAALLGVTPMALYHHVAGKDALLDLVNEAVWLDVRWPAPKGRGRWRAHLGETARAIRSALRIHPRTAPLVATRPARAPAVLAAIDGLLGSLADAGFGPREALYAVDVMGIFVVGHGQAEFGVSPYAAPERQGRDLARVRAGLAEAGLSRLARTVTRRHDYDLEFEFGLETLLAGLAARIRSRPPALDTARAAGRR